MIDVPPEVTLVEVGPRDGLQNEATQIPTADKIRFVDALSDAGHRVIEVSAFVSARWVPQMADAADVFAGLRRRPGVRYTALVPNLAGLERARAAGVDDVAVFASASERFSRANTNHGIDEMLAVHADVAAAAASAGVRVRGYVSCAFGCPFEGEVSVDAVVRVTRRLLEIGVYEVAVSDTIGVAHPAHVRSVLRALTGDIPVTRLALHLHDTRGTALANALIGLDLGVATFDTAAGGLGGCPYAPGASGNLATEDLLHMLDGLGVRTGVSLSGVLSATALMAPIVGHAPRSRFARVALAAGRDATPPA